MASMEVEELEELLVQQKKKLREMAERQNVANEDSSSVESGFVSLAGREEEGGGSGLGGSGLGVLGLGGSGLGVSGLGGSGLGRLELGA